MTEYLSSARPLLSDPLPSRLKTFVIESTGLTYYGSRDEDLAYRMSRRLSKLGINDWDSYLELLQDEKNGQAEFDALVTELTIGETYFFRHSEQFMALRDIVLPDIIRRKQQSRRLRIWSAGCATGPELYSLAILLKRDLAHLLEGWDVSILGTDINREFLAAAMEGRYDEWAFRSCPEDVRRSCFSRAGKSWVIAPIYKQWVSLQYHNLVKHAFPSLVQNLSALDLILCRNVMIYFDTEIIRKLVAHFRESLMEGGWLLVGHSESNPELFRSFRTISVPGAILYQNLGEAATERSTASIDPQDERLGAEVESGLGASLENALPIWSAASPISDLNFAATLSEAMPEAVKERADPEQAEPGSPELAAIRQLANAGEWETAAQRCQKLLEREQINATAHFYKALVLEQMGHHRESELSLRRAIYLDRNFILAHYYLGLCLQKKRDTLRAAQSFQNVSNLLCKLDPGHTFVEGDGITAADLKELTEMNLRVLRGA